MERIISGNPLDEMEKENQRSLRPPSFEEFPGQTKVKEKLKVFVEAAKKRGEPLDHTLLCGPPGLGKTTLGHIMAHEMGVEVRSTSGPALHRKGDLAAVLTTLKPGMVFFIDEIHRLNKEVEEYLYSAMEDFYIDIVTGEGLGARTMKFQLAPFTLIGATTRAGLLKAPFRDRFGVVERLEFYNAKDLTTIVLRSAKILDIPVSQGGAEEIARRSRGTPRVANRILRRVRDYALVTGRSKIDEEMADYALLRLEVDKVGLDGVDRKILTLIQDKFAGGPVGIDTLAAALSEEVQTLEEVHEPYLIQEGFLVKTPRGRIISERARVHLSESPTY